jgi:DNA-binding HxlR family transcriptional regulator
LLLLIDDNGNDVVRARRPSAGRLGLGGCFMELTIHRAFHYATRYSDFMQRTSFEEMNCSIARSLDIVGEWWSLLIVRDAFLGVTKFDDFQARLGISRNILTQRLNHLVDNEILQRVPYQDHPPRYEYRLTEKGRDLAHVVTAIREWGDRWVAPDGPPLKLRHNKCGHVAKTVSVCSHCGERLDLEDVTAFPGPGSVPGDYDRTRLEGLSTKRRVTRST